MELGPQWVDMEQRWNGIYWEKLSKCLFLVQVQGRKTLSVARGGVRVHSVSRVGEPNHLFQLSGAV